MEVFTYNNYITCIHTLRLNSVSKLAEESEKYNLEIDNQKKNLNDIYKEMIKEILKNKNEIAGIVNDFIDTSKKIKGKYLEKCTNKKYNLDGNVVYRLKDKDIFFLIRYQKELDDKILYKMLNFCVEIIYNWNISVKIKNEIKYPIVVPIIIYTGTKMWNITCDFSAMQVNDYRFKGCTIDFRYNLIDINKISVETFIQKNTLFSYAMALGKARNHEQFKNILNQILISSEKNKALQRRLLSNLLKVLKNTNKETSKPEFLEKNKGEKENITKNEDREKIVKNIKKELVKILTSDDSSEEEILRIVNITKSELDEYKEELQINAQH